MNGLPARLEQPKTPVPSSTFEVVARRIDLPTPLVQRLVLDSTLFEASTTLDLGKVGVLRIDKPFSAIRTGSATVWQAAGRLYGRRPRIVRFARVELDLVAWSADASELRVRPVARHLPRWGVRRQRQYFVSAHQSADFVAQMLTAAARRCNSTYATTSSKRSRVAAA